MAKKKTTKTIKRAVWADWNSASMPITDLRGETICGVVVMKLIDKKEVPQVKPGLILTPHPLEPTWPAEVCDGEGPGDYDCGGFVAVVCSDDEWKVRAEG